MMYVSLRQDASTLRRRRFQYRVRTLMLLILVASIGMSWFAVTLRRATRQRDAVKTIVRLGGFVTYDYMIDHAGNQRPNPQGPAPEWLRRMLGDDFFARVVAVNLDSTEVTDADLECLKPLSHLRRVNLFNTRITDAGLKHLKPLPRLQRLELGGTQVTDAGLEHLKGLTELQSVYGGNGVTDEGMKRLQQALPKLVW